MPAALNLNSDGTRTEYLSQQVIKRIPIEKRSIHLFLMGFLNFVLIFVDLTSDRISALTKFHQNRSPKCFTTRFGFIVDG